MNSRVDKIVATRSFVQAVKSLKSDHKNKELQELHQAIQDLAEFNITTQKSNHPLKNAQGHIDLHLAGGKLILLYRYDNEILYISLRLQDVVDHKELKNYDTKKYSNPAKEYDAENIINSTAIKGATMGIYKFYDWYNGLTYKQKLEVDDYADTWNYPDYDDCDSEDLSALHKHFVSKFAQEDRSKPNFHVACFGNDYNELQDSFDTTDPKQAIAKWVQWQQKYPLDVMITGFAEGEQALRDYVVQHQDWIRQICNKYECPYDPEYLIKESEKPSRMKDSQYTDQLHPFGLG